MRTVFEKARAIPLAGSYDVVVCGGGPAGVSAAISSARSGARTMLVERGGSLGGLAAGGPVLVFSGLASRGEPVVQGICREVIGELARVDAVRDEENVVFDPESLKRILDAMVLESGADLLLGSFAVGAECDGDRVRHIFVENKSGRQAYEARYVIDASGDGDSVRWCDIDFLKPVPSLIREISPVFRMGNVDLDAYHRYLERDGGRTSGSVELGEGVRLYFSGWYETINPGEVWLDALFLEGIDPTDASDITTAEILSRKYVRKAVEHIRELPGFGNAFLSETSPMLGVRESRHICGRYTLGVDDIGGSRPDAIARVVNASNRYAGAIEIPYGCLLPEFMENLLYAGRCISATREVYDSVRTIPGCMATGQAAGTAAALCARSDGAASSALDIDALRSELRKNGALI